MQGFVEGVLLASQKTCLFICTMQTEDLLVKNYLQLFILSIASFTNLTVQ